MSDQHRHDALSYLGHPVVKTPNLDRLAERSVLFNNAYCPEALCIPSRVSCFTGLFPHHSGAIKNHARNEYIDTGDASLIEDFKSAGYRTGLAGKNHAFTDEYFDRFFDSRVEYGHAGRMSDGGDEFDKAYNEFGCKFF